MSRTNENFYTWVRNNGMAIAVFMLVCSGSVQNVLLLNCGLFGLQMFSAPIPDYMIGWLKVANLLNCVIEKGPQMWIQVSLSSPSLITHSMLAVG